MKNKLTIKEEVERLLSYAYGEDHPKTFPNAYRTSSLLKVLAESISKITNEITSGKLSPPSDSILYHTSDYEYKFLMSPEFGKHDIYKWEEKNGVKQITLYTLFQHFEARMYPVFIFKFGNINFRFVSTLPLTYAVHSSFTKGAGRWLITYLTEDKFYEIIEEFLTEEEGREGASHEPSDEDVRIEFENKYEVATLKELESIKEAGRYGFVSPDLERDTYIFTFPFLNELLEVDSQTINEIYEDYTKMGKNYNANQICMKYEFPRNVFDKMRQVLGLYKTSLPLPDAEIRDHSVSDLVKSTLEAKKKKVFVEAEKKRERALEKEAENFRNIHTWLEEFYQNVELPKVQLERGEFGYPTVEREAYLALTDLHIGKMSYKLDTHLESEVQTYLKAVEYISYELEERGVSSVHLPIGSDLLHIDTTKLETTRGTPMARSTVPEHWSSIYGYTTSFIQSVIEIFLKRGMTINAYVVEGNHDRTVCYCVGHHVKAVFSEYDEVEVDTSQSTRKYFLVKEHLNMITHGDTEKQDVQHIAAYEARNELGAHNWRGLNIFTGHLHHNKHKGKTFTSHGSEEYLDINKWQSPAPCGPDIWHKNAGYLAGPAKLAYYIFDETGSVSTVGFRRVKPV